MGHNRAQQKVAKPMKTLAQKEADYAAARYVVFVVLSYVVVVVVTLLFKVACSVMR